MLKIENLTTSFGSVVALDGVSMTAHESKITTVIGANGAGKSTLLRTISGLESPASGLITWEGQSIVGRKPEDIVRAGIAHVPEGHAVISELSVEENINMGSLFRRRSHKTDVAASLEEMYQLFPRLQERRKQLAGTLSGGERQMVAMGRALMMNPSVLLLDEPSAGLSPALQDEVFVRVREINKIGVTVIMVEQNARRCLQIVDRGYVLDQGTNAYEGTGKSLSTDPKVIELYLGTLAK